MKRLSVAWLRGTLVLGLLVVAACTTGTDVADGAPSPEEQARLDRIAQLAHKLVDNARTQPDKPASALVADLVLILQEAEVEGQ